MSITSVSSGERAVGLSDEENVPIRGRFATADSLRIRRVAETSSSSFVRASASHVDPERFADVCLPPRDGGLRSRTNPPFMYMSDCTLWEARSARSPGVSLAVRSMRRRTLQSGGYSGSVPGTRRSSSQHHPRPAHYRSRTHRFIGANNRTERRPPCNHRAYACSSIVDCRNIMSSVVVKRVTGDTRVSYV